MPNGTLDDVDIELLAVLRRDGRASFQALSDCVGLSRTAVRSRVQHLLDTGLARVVGMVHPSVCGLSVDARLLIRADGDPAEAARLLSQRESVYGAQVTTGHHDVLLRLRTGDEDALAAEADAIREHPHVRIARVFRAATTVVDPAAPIAACRPHPLDAVDWRLLELLERDGRASFAQLAPRIDCPRRPAAPASSPCCTPASSTSPR